MNLFEPVLLSISANLDTFTMAMSYGMKKIRLRIFSILLIALITTAGTFVSMVCGAALTQVITVRAASLIGSVLLTGLGVWMVMDYYKTLQKDKRQKDHAQPSYCDILADPVKADKDSSGTLDAKEAVALAIALTINNVGIGIAASVAGIDLFLNTACTFIFTFLSIALGVKVGNRFVSRFLGKYAGLFSGLIVIALGIYEAIAG